MAKNMAVLKKEASTPLYVQIKKYLKQEIISEKLQRDQRCPSEWELARKFKVSRVTSRAAINELVVEGLLYRVQGKGTFVCGKGKSLAPTGNSSKVNNIGLVVVSRDITHPYYVLLLKGIDSAIQKSGYNLMYSSMEIKYGETELEWNFPLFVQEQNVGGLIVSGAGASKVAPVVQRMGIPAVFHGRFSGNNSEYHCVGIDNVKVGSQVAKHLLSMGHRSIGMVNGPPYHGFAERLQGFKGVLEEEGLQVDPKHFRECDDQQEKQGYFAMREIFGERNGLPTAIFCGNDNIAMGVMQAILEKGLKIPEDISLIGVDNLQLRLGKGLMLTTVDPMEIQIGETMVTKLLDLIQGKKPQKETIIPTRIIERETCANLTEAATAVTPA